MNKIYLICYLTPNKRVCSSVHICKTRLDAIKNFKKRNIFSPIMAITELTEEEWNKANE